MKRDMGNAEMDAAAEKVLLKELTALARQVSQGHYAEARAIFELTKTGTYPRAVTDLAEAFGMMIVKVESREFKLEQLLEEVESACRELAVAKKALEALNLTLERRVKERTAQCRKQNTELAKTLKILNKEARERRQAEKNLQMLYGQLEEANRKLLDAYLQMRQRKDRLAARQYVESIVFLVDAEGRIRGVTENAVAMSRRSRSDLDQCSIEEVLAAPQGETVTEILRKVRPRMACLTQLKLKDPADGEGSFYEAKLTRVAVEGKRLISVVLHEPIEK